MQVDKTNDISSYQKRNMAYTAAGLGAGVVAGGAFGYFQKPWLKNGDITDTFIKEVETKADKFDLQTLETSINELKKASETGNFEHLSKDTLELFSEENKQKMKDLGPDKVKELANEKLEKLRIVVVAENNDEIIQRAKELQKEMSCTSYNKKIQVLKSFKIDDNISADDIAKLYEEKLTGCELEFDLDEGESLKDYFQRQINKDGKTSIVNELKKDIAEQIQEYQNEITEYKNSIKEHIDISGKKLKDMPAEADAETKSLYNSIKKTISEMNWKNAGKWAGIGAVALGAIGQGTAFLTGKKPADLPAEQIKQ